MSSGAPPRGPAAPRVETAGIVVIGDEILSGKVQDTNCNYLIGELRALGVALRRVAYIPDVLDEIATTVRAFAGTYDHVFTSGGVGPTHDDMTMEGIARAFGTTVIRHPRLEQMLRDFYGARLEERNLRMAEVPDGAALVESDSIIWPVVTFGNVYILPGVPEIFRRKFGAIRERFRAAPWHLAAVYTGEDEGRIAGHLDAVVARFPEVAIGSYPRIVAEGWRVKVTLESKDAAEVARAAAELVERLGPECVLSVER